MSDRQVAVRFDISKATVWRWHDNNPDFPRRIKLSPGTSRWKLSELVQFEAKMQAERRSSIITPAKGLSK
ncbi:DNA-binding protein [Planktotalea sp.]|uniref:helix-turn-helix transcriptional regulator n=1 Tax=Planktotalea sp. TaxID=2029877 RepID=UPI00329A52A3